MSLSSLGLLQFVGKANANDNIDQLEMMHMDPDCINRMTQFQFRGAFESAQETGCQGYIIPASASPSSSTSTITSGEQLVL